MGKPKQRPRLSTGFAAAKQTQRILSTGLKSTPTSDNVAHVKPSLTSGSSAPAWLTELRSGKITKTKAKKRRQPNVLSNVSSTQVLDSAVTHNVSQLPVALNSGGSSNSTNASPFDPQAFLTATRKQMKLVVRSKKSRVLIKKEVFRKKVEDIKAEEKSKKEKKVRQKTVIVGDMRPILDALPPVLSLDDEIQNLINQCNDSGGKLKPKRKLTMKRRQEEIAQGLKYFSAKLKT